LTGGWDAPKQADEKYSRFVETWRKQNPKVAKSIKEEIQK
jgi:hypothetical protein